MTKTIAVDLPERLSTELDILVEKGWFSEPAEIIRLALWEFVRHHRFALVEQFQRADIAWALELHRTQQSHDSDP